MQDTGRSIHQVKDFHGRLIIHVIILFLSFQILNLCQEKEEIERKMHTIIDNFAERGLRSLAVAFQVFNLLHITC